MSTPATTTPSAPWEHTLNPFLATQTPGTYRRYFALFFLITALAYVSAFFLIRSSSYTEWRQSQWGPMLEYGFNPGPRSADVVIFGDSSAFIGVDPRIIQQQLPVSAVILPNTVGSLPITKDIALQHYLQTHRRPKLLVLYFSPWNLNYNQAEGVRFFEGEEMIFRHGTPSNIAHFVLHYPAQFLFFPFRFYNTYGAGIVKSLLPHRTPSSESVAGALGHLDDYDAFPQLAPTCSVPERLLLNKGSASLAALAKRYLDTVPVMVYIAPIPGCTNVSQALHLPFAEVGAAPPPILPASDFVGDPYYAHIEPAAVPVATQLLVQAIRSRLMPSQSGAARN